MTRNSKCIYEDNYKNTKYAIELSWNENEVIFNIKEENILNKEFGAYFSLTSLIEKNPIFKVFNKTEDCYNYLLKLFNNKKYNIIKEANKLIITILMKNLITEKDEEMKLYLNSKTLEINTIIESYSNIIKDLKNENNILKGEISILKDEVLKLKNISQEYKSFKDNINSIIDERINQYINQQKEKEKENKIFNDLNYSSILTNYDEKNFSKT